MIAVSYPTKSLSFVCSYMFKCYILKLFYLYNLFIYSKYLVTVSRETTDRKSLRPIENPKNLVPYIFSLKGQPDSSCDFPQTSLKTEGAGLSVETMK